MDLDNAQKNPFQLHSTPLPSQEVFLAQMPQSSLHALALVPNFPNQATNAQASPPHFSKFKSQITLHAKLVEDVIQMLVH